MKAFKFLLIMGVCLGLNLEAGHDCVCKPRVTKEMKRAKKEAHHAAHKKTKKAFKEMRLREKQDKNKCYCAGVFQTIPADKVLVDNGRVKRDSNGDRI